MSGLSRTPGKRVWVHSPTRVRIPPSPPFLFVSSPHDFSMPIGAATKCLSPRPRPLRWPAQHDRVARVGSAVVVTNTMPPGHYMVLDAPRVGYFADREDELVRVAEQRPD